MVCAFIREGHKNLSINEFIETEAEYIGLRMCEPYEVLELKKSRHTPPSITQNLAPMDNHFQMKIYVFLK